jgi:hypothetical protein
VREREGGEGERLQKCCETDHPKKEVCLAGDDPGKAGKGGKVTPVLLLNRRIFGMECVLVKFVKTKESSTSLNVTWDPDRSPT